MKTAIMIPLKSFEPSSQDLRTDGSSESLAHSSIYLEASLKLRTIAYTPKPMLNRRCKKIIQKYNRTNASFREMAPIKL
jgi:hypothetical protein